jgi:lysophospholipase L1-like esterase
VLGVAQPELELLNLARRDLRAAAVVADQLPAGLAFAPDLAVVVAGGNDLFGRAFDADAVEGELDTIVAGLTGIGATVVLVTLMDIVRAVPRLAGGAMERLPVLNDRIRAVALRHGALVLDAFAHPMCADRDVYSADFKHPTGRGHAILATETLRVLATRVHG